MTIDPKDVFDNKILQYTLTSETEKTWLNTNKYTHLAKYTHQHREKGSLYSTLETTQQNLSLRTLILLDIVSIVSFDQAKIN